MKTSKIILGLFAGLAAGIIIKRYLDSKFENSRGITQQQIDKLREHFQSGSLNDGMSNWNSKEANEIEEEWNS